MFRIIATNLLFIMRKIILRYFYLFCGIFFLGLGLVLFVLPIFPFLLFLISTFFFSRSSRKLKAIMLSNKIFGTTLRSIIVKQALPLQIKVFTFISANISLGIFFYLNETYYKLLNNYTISALILNIFIAVLPSYFEEQKE